MMEMVVQGVSTRNVQKITQQLYDEFFSRSAVPEMCRELDGPVKKFRDRPLDTCCPFVMADAIYIKVREKQHIVSKAVLTAVGINLGGRKEVLRFDVCGAETEGTWRDFFTGLKDRGLSEGGTWWSPMRTRGCGRLPGKASRGARGRGARSISYAT